MIGDDERRRVTIWGHIAFISGHCDKFWSIRAIVRRFEAIGNEFETFAVDLWRLRRVEMIVRVQCDCDWTVDMIVSELHNHITTIIDSQCDCCIAVDRLQKKWLWFELIMAICDELQHLDDDGSKFGVWHEWKVSAAMSSAPFRRRQMKFGWRQINKIQQLLH